MAPARADGPHSRLSNAERASRRTLPPTTAHPGEPPHRYSSEMSDIRIYHNPACSHSRGALEILEERSADAEVVLYLETPPSRVELERFLDLLDDPAADLVRKDKRFAELGLVESDYQTPEEVVAVLLEHPELMQRPIIVKDDRAVLARPSEKVLALLED
jgi:arsenate reductase